MITIFITFAYIGFTALLLEILGIMIVDFPKTNALIGLLRLIKRICYTISSIAGIIALIKYYFY